MKNIKQLFRVVFGVLFITIFIIGFFIWLQLRLLWSRIKGIKSYLKDSISRAITFSLDNFVDRDYNMFSL